MRRRDERGPDARLAQEQRQVQVVNRFMRNPLLAAARVAVAAMVLVGCDRIEEILPAFEEPLTPREGYVAALESAGLGSTALVSDWTVAGERALLNPVTVTEPFAEDGYIAPEQPTALGWRFSARRGRRLTVTARIGPDSAAQLFVDLFELPSDTADPPRQVLTPEPGPVTLDFEPRRDGEYILRIQPELLRGGRYSVEIRSAAALGFPVQDRSTRDIQSVFGDVRDGGRRDHHGVDIFAPRGTPVVAAARGYVRRVRTTPRGGKVVWLRDDERGLSLYYAHLDSQLVESGQQVEIGDTLGLVGNTGNARTTPPHLHFGIYQRGPIDPWWWVHHGDTTPSRLAVDTAAFGDWTRTTGDEIRLRAGPDEGFAAIAELPRHTALHVIGGTGGWFRVALPDGREGFIASRLTEAVDRPVRRTRLATATALHARPAPDAAMIDRIAPGEVPVLARFGEYFLVRIEGRPAGWLALE